MATTYATLASVKDLLKTRWRLRQGSAPLQFSESYSDLKRYNGNTGSINLTRVDNDNSFAGDCRFKAIFGDDTTTATLYMSQGQNEIDQLEIGSGSRFSTITGTNPFTGDTILTIAPSYWVGGAVSGDYIQWKTSSLISNNQAEEIINDAENCIDLGILEHGLLNAANTSRLFASGSVPLGIQTATKYLAGYMFYSIIFSTSKLAESEVFQWFRLADNNVTKYVKSIPRHGAGWGARKKILRPDSVNDIVPSHLYGSDIYCLDIDSVENRIQNYRRNPNYLKYISRYSNLT